MRAHEYLAELADQPYKLQYVQHGAMKSVFGFETDSGAEYVVDIHPLSMGNSFQNNLLNVSFALLQDGEVVDTQTGQAGQDALKIFGTVLETVKASLAERTKQGLDIEYIRFTAKNQEPKRVALYSRMAKNISRYLPGWSYDSTVPAAGSTSFIVKRTNTPEQVAEYVNQDMLRPDWHEEKTIKIASGTLELSARYHGAVADQIIITAKLNGQEVGQVRFVVSTVNRQEPTLVAGNLNVDREYQRRGIARAMYNWALELGNTVEPSHTQTDAGRAFWRGNKFTAYEMAMMEGGHAISEDWRHWVAGLGAASALAGGGGAAYDAYQASQQAQEPAAQVQQLGKHKAPQITQQHIELAKDLLSSTPAQLLIKVATAAGIKGAELTQFLAQTAHESANFSTTKEFGDKNYFKKYDIRFNPEKAKILGNLRPGDGERYKGRGFIQLTGKYNYEKAGQALGLDLVKHPELAERPDVAAKIAVWFWKNRVQPKVDNFNNTVDATKPINPALKGLQDRHIKFQSMKQALTKPQTQVAQAPTAKPATPALNKTAAQAPQSKPAAKPATKPATKVAVKPAPAKGKKV